MLKEKIVESWRDYPARKVKGDTAQKEASKSKKKDGPYRNRAEWFESVARDFVCKEGVSRMALARNYAFLCRERSVWKEDRHPSPEPWHCVGKSRTC